MTESFPTARTIKKTMIDMMATTIVVNRKSWRVEPIAIAHSSGIILLTILFTTDRKKGVQYALRGSQFKQTARRATT